MITGVENLFKIVSHHVSGSAMTLVIENTSGSTLKVRQINYKTTRQDHTVKSGSFTFYETFEHGERIKSSSQLIFGVLTLELKSVEIDGREIPMRGGFKKVFLGWSPKPD